MTETEELIYETDAWIALTETWVSPYIIPQRLGWETMVPFGSLGKIVTVKELEPGQTERRYVVAFHAGWVALDVPHDILRPARMLEQLALCADGC